jgi:hypothetical protein
MTLHSYANAVLTIRNLYLLVPTYILLILFLHLNLALYKYYIIILNSRTLVEFIIFL